jgi:hypothetical protein
MLTRKYPYPRYITGTSLCSLYHNRNLCIVYRKVRDIFLFLCASFLLMGDVNKKRSSTPDVLRSRSRMSSDSSRNDPSESFSMADTLSQQSDQSPMVSNLPQLSIENFPVLNLRPQICRLRICYVLPGQSSHVPQEVVKDECAAVLEY